MQNVRPDMLFSFAGENSHADEGTPSLNTPGFRSAGPMIAIEDELAAEVVESISTHDVIKFWPWVQQVMSPRTHKMRAILTTDFGDKTPLTVSPQLPLEIAMQLFKRMG